MESKLKILNLPMDASIYLTPAEIRSVWNMRNTVQYEFDEDAINFAIDTFIELCILKKVMCN